MNPSTPTAPTPDRGAALLIAIGALSIVAILGAVLLAEAQADVRRAERLVDRTEGDHLIEVPVAEAWARIVDGETRSFVVSGTAATGTWSVQATPIDGRWELDVEVNSTGDELTGSITVSREPLLPYTLIVADATTGPLQGRVDGRVAISGAATFSGRSLGDVQELVGSGATCSGCDNAIEVATGETTVPLPLLPSAACPDVDGVITGALAGNFHYLCTTPDVLTISGVISTDGTVVLSAGSDVDLVLDHAAIHVGGTPTEFFIHSDSTSDTAVAVIDSDFHGVLSAPDGRLTTDDFRWEGTVAARELRAIAGSELTGDWSVDLTTLGFGGWRITQWQTARS